MEGSFANSIKAPFIRCYTVLTEKLGQTKSSATKSKRQEWAGRSHFLFTSIGLLVGLSNISVFPALAYENGGSAFYLLYAVLNILVGIPLTLLELSVGQTIGMGPTGVYKIFPAAEGVGYSMVFGNSLIALTYICNVSYALYYLFATMQSKLPWTWCRETWMDACCFIPNSKGLSLSVCDGNRTANFSCNSNKYCKCSGHLEFDFNPKACSAAIQEIARNASYFTMTRLAENCSLLQHCTNNTHSPSQFYFFRDVIRKSPHLDYLGPPIWHMTLCYLLSWIMVVFCLRKGIQSFRKVVPFTALVPYGLIMLLYIKTAMLPGSGQGVSHLMVADWSKLATFKAWRLALSQLFFSLSTGLGQMIMFGSLCPLHQNLHIDCLVITSLDLITSFMAGLLVFSTVGALAHEKGIPMADISKSGLQLVFVNYPEALSMLQIPHLWCLAYFLLLFLLGFDSQVGMVVLIVTTMVDEFPRMRSYISEVTIGIGVVTFLIGLPFVTPGGPILKSVVDVYGIEKPTFILCFAEIVVLIWLYGVNRFFDDLEWMIGYRPRPQYYWKGCLFVIAPLVVLTLCIYSITTFDRVPEMQPGVKIPIKVQVLGWFICFGVLLPIPLYFVKNVWKAKGDTLLQKLQAASRPKCEWLQFRKLRHHSSDEISHEKRRPVIHEKEASEAEKVENSIILEDNLAIKNVTEDGLNSTSERTEDISNPSPHSPQSKANKHKRKKKKVKTTEVT